MALIYLDMCALKRPFDDHSALRIRDESEAVMLIVLNPLQYLKEIQHAGPNDG